MSPFSFFAFSPLSCWISHLKKLLIEQSGVSVRFTIDGIGITWLASNPVPPLLSMIVRKPRATLRHFRSRRDIFMLALLEWRNGVYVTCYYVCSTFTFAFYPRSMKRARMAAPRHLRDDIIAAYSLSGCSSKEIQTLLQVEYRQTLR